MAVHLWFNKRFVNACYLVGVCLLATLVLLIQLIIITTSNYYQSTPSTDASNAKLFETIELNFKSEKKSAIFSKRVAVIFTFDEPKNIDIFIQRFANGAPISATYIFRASSSYPDEMGSRCLDDSGEEESDNFRFDFVISIRHFDNKTGNLDTIFTLLRQIGEKLGQIRGLFANVDFYDNLKLPDHADKNEGILTRSPIKDADEQGRRLARQIFPFSVDFFGGRSENFAKLCREVGRCYKNRQSKISDNNADSKQDLRQCFNLYLRGGEKPSHYIGFTGRLMKVDSNYLVDLGYIRRSLMGLIQLRRSIAQARRRRVQVDKIVRRLEDHYFRNISAELAFEDEGASSTRLVRQFLGYSCELWTLCGGLGDRLKGVASLFYMAIATKRIFYFDWQKPVPLKVYFHINRDWYDFGTKNSFTAQSRLARLGRFWWWPMDSAANELADQVSNTTFITDYYSNVSAFDITTNRFRMLKPLFENEAFLPQLGEIFPELIVKTHKNLTVDYSLVISAAYRSIFSKPKFKLANLVNKLIESSTGMGLETFNRDVIKIGLQIRTCRSNWGEDESRVVQAQFKCFASKAVRIARDIASLNLKANKTVAIYVTSDSENATELVRRFIEANKEATSAGGRFLVFSTNSYFSEKFDIRSEMHLDRSFASRNKSVAWLETAKVYVDWLVLTKMDFLLISRSGFGETASLYSLVPTWQFVHWPPRPNDPCPFDEYTAQKDVSFEQ